eukprot:5612431-Amphidinium_carterae.1
MISQDLACLALQSVLCGPGQEGALQRVRRHPFHFLRRGSARTQQLTQPFRSMSRAQWLLAEPATDQRARHHGRLSVRDQIKEIPHPHPISEP